MPDDQAITTALIMDFLAVDENREMVAEVLWPAFFDQSRGRVLPETKDYGKTRWLLNGADITANQAGTQVAAKGESFADRVNIIGGGAYWSNKPESRQLNIQAGGAGADCLFDYLVSSCFATLSGFTEGQTFSSLSGCTFKGYSTLSGMQTALQTAGVAATVAICGGTYNETWTINGTNLNGKRVSYFGASSAKVLVSALAFASGAFTDTKGLTIKEIGVTSVDLTGCDSTWFEDCILSAMTIGTASSTIRDVHFKNCEIGAVTGANNVSWSTCSFENCIVTSLVFSTGSCNLGPIRIESCTVGGIDQGTGGTGTDVQILDSKITGSVNSGANVVRITNCTGLIITGCELDGGTSGPSILLHEQNGRTWGFDISGNRFDTNTNGYLGTSAANKEVQRGFFGGNSFYTNGGAAVKATHATADFGYVTFGPNAPDCMDYSSVVSDSGTSTNVFYTSCTVPTGATHPLYGTGTSSTGAPVDAQYLTLAANATLTNERIWTPGNGLQGTDSGAGANYTAALGLLIADWNQTANFNIVHGGHLAVGVGVVADAASILAFNEGFTVAGPASGQKNAIAGTVTRTLSGADSGALFGMDMVTKIAGAFADTGISYGVRSQVQRLDSGGTSSDIRNFQAELTKAFGTVITDRYGFRVKNATGTGTLTNQYGLHIENLTGGGTLNVAIRSLGGQSRHVGNFTIGADATPTDALDVTGNVAVKADNQLKLYDADNSNFISLRADSARTTDLVYVLPATDPTVGQVLSASAPVAGVVTLSWIAAGGATTLAPQFVWFTAAPVIGDWLPYQSVQFNGGAGTAKTLVARAKHFGYGTTTVNILKGAHALPNTTFATMLTSDLNIEASAMGYSGMEDVQITAGALSVTALANNDTVRCDIDATGEPLSLTVTLSLTSP